MTGYGLADAETGDIKALIEVKSVNHRFCEVKIKSGGKTASVDERIKKTTTGRFQRGYFEIAVTLTDKKTEGQSVKINEAALESYMKLASSLQERFGVAYPPSFGDILSQKDITNSATVDPADPEKLWNSIKPALVTAFDQLDKTRTIEGAHTQTVVLDRLDTIEKELDLIKLAHEASTEERHEKLKARISKILDKEGFPEDARMLQEVAILIDKSDISEEMDRLESHMAQTRGLLEADGVAGRKLEFFVQEINREINTIGSKTTSPKATSHVVEIKSELEKIREQAQNIE